MDKKQHIEEMAKIVDEMYNVYTTTAEDINGKIKRGRITDIYSDEQGNTLYILRNGLGKINSGYDNFGGFRKYHLYDNKEDCKNLAHYASDCWEL